MYRDQTGHSLWVEVGVGDRPTETALGEPCALLHLGQPLLPSQGAQVWAPVPSFPEMLGMDNPHQGWGLVLLEWPPPTPTPPLWVPPSPWESVCPPNLPTLHFLGIPCKWKHTHSAFCLASSTQHVFKVHPGCSMCHNFTLESNNHPYGPVSRPHLQATICVQSLLRIALRWMYLHHL